MSIDPRHLEQIAKIVEHGTLHEAARQLGTSQPALSRMIRHLEDRVGAKLFERNSRPLVPTDICKTFAKHGRSIVAIRQKAMEDVQLDRNGMIGELRIGAPPFLCERLVGDTISAFLSERPDINLKLTAQYFPDLERKLMANEVDMIICPLRHLTIQRSEMTVLPLFEDKHVVVARQTHTLAHAQDITPTQLESATWIGHSQTSMLRSDMAAALAAIGVRNVNIAFQTESAGSILRMLRTTDFLTILPSYAIPKSDGLCALPVKLLTTPMTVGIVTPIHQHKGKLQSAFEAFLQAYATDNTIAMGDTA